MPSYDAMVERYRTRQRAWLVDAIAAGLSYADEVSVDLGLLADTGLLTDILGAVSFGLPFTLIAITEGSKALLGRKTTEAARQDAAWRMLKTGTSMGAGAVLAAAGAGFLPAIPVTVGVRILLERYRGSMLCAYRVQQRIDRLRALREKRQNPAGALPRLTGENYRAALSSN